MCVNYMLEIIGLDDWELTHPLSATAYKLMRKLQYLANKERFPERMNVSNGLLMSMVGCSEDSLIKARNQLIQAGLIQYKGQKKITPLYMIQYFSLNPAYNTKIQSMEQGMKQGYEQGMMLGKEHGTYINNTDKGVFEPDEDIQPLSVSAGRARARDPMPQDEKQMEKLLPPRQNEWELPPHERRWLMAARGNLNVSPLLKETFAGQETMVRRIIDSSRFPPEMVSCAMDKTAVRNGRYPLDNPVAYMLTLLFDWEEKGLKTVQALREYMDGWTPTSEVCADGI